jgi:hypothetical protein
VKELDMSGYSQVATWWENEKVREFTKLECGLLGALFSAVAIGFIVTFNVILG